MNGLIDAIVKALIKALCTLLCQKSKHSLANELKDKDKK